MNNKFKLCPIKMSNYPSGQPQLHPIAVLFLSFYKPSAVTLIKSNHILRFPNIANMFAVACLDHNGNLASNVLT